MKIKDPGSLTERACTLIRTAILDGKIDSGQRLTEDLFARRFGISKSPIREAFNRLESEGLIAIHARRGAFVVDLTRRDVEEIYELRGLLEPAVVRHIVLDAKTTAQLEATVTNAEKFLRKNDKTNYIHEDARFHIILAEANSNGRLRRALQAMQHQMIILRHRTFDLSSAQAVQHHRAILDALKKGNREMAAGLMADHIGLIRGRLLSDMDHKHTGSITIPVPAVTSEERGAIRLI